MIGKGFDSICDTSRFKFFDKGLKDLSFQLLILGSVYILFKTNPKMNETRISANDKNELFHLILFNEYFSILMINPMKLF